MRLEKELEEATKRSNLVIGEAYEAYVDQLREEIKELPRSSKKWWRLNRFLLGRAAKKSSAIPPLRNAKQEWILESAEKAEREEGASAREERTSARREGASEASAEKERAKRAQKWSEREEGASAERRKLLTAPHERRFWALRTSAGCWRPARASVVGVDHRRAAAAKA